MALTDSLPTGDAGGLTIADERLILAGLIAKNADGSPRVGVFPSGVGALVTGRASMGYDIAPFKAATSRTGLGVELLANDATVVNVPTDAAPSANSRLDVIYARAQFTSSADPGNVPIFGVAKGTAAPVPTKPPLPAGALELAVAEIPSTATTTASVVITPSAPFTAAAGGIVLLRNAAELAAFAAADGTIARRLDNGILQYRTGGAWVAQPAPPFAEAAGQFTAATVGFSTVAFPAGRFTQPPIVQVQLLNGTSGAIGATARITGVTTTGFQVSPTVTGPLMWTAVQMLAGSAAG